MLTAAQLVLFFLGKLSSLGLVAIAIWLAIAGRG